MPKKPLQEVQEQVVDENNDLKEKLKKLKSQKERANIQKEIDQLEKEIPKPLDNIQNEINKMEKKLPVPLDSPIKTLLKKKIKNPFKQESQEEVGQPIRGPAGAKEDSDAFTERTNLKISAKQIPRTSQLDLANPNRARMEMAGGNYGFIYKNDMLLRVVPFIWQQDIETRNTWAIFKAHEFYGLKQSTYPWRRLKTQVLVIPFDKSSDSCDLTPRGYGAKFDEASISQLSMHWKETAATRRERVDDLRFLSQNLQLYRDLQKYTQAKWNMFLIIMAIVIIIIAVAGIYIWKTNPHFLNNLFGSFGIH
jgi:flagellin-like hook-associated protein FlgL